MPNTIDMTHAFDSTGKPDAVMDPSCCNVANACGIGMLTAMRIINTVVLEPGETPAEPTIPWVVAVGPVRAMPTLAAFAACVGAMSASGPQEYRRMHGVADDEWLATTWTVKITPGRLPHSETVEVSFVIGRVPDSAV